ncbi:MAG: hypothetical protein JWP78_3013 [Mucilaginibacter sp.]|nr:hypothetical protein [Mucilaginibacter sp.]
MNFRQQQLNTGSLFVFQETGFKHYAHAVNLTINFLVIICKTYLVNQRSLFQCGSSAFTFKLWVSITESPSFNRLPLLSFTIIVSITGFFQIPTNKKA